MSTPRPAPTAKRPRVETSGLALPTTPSSNNTTRPTSTYTTTNQGYAPRSGNTSASGSGSNTPWTTQSYVAPQTGNYASNASNPAYPNYYQPPSYSQQPQQQQPSQYAQSHYYPSTAYPQYSNAPYGNYPQQPSGLRNQYTTSTPPSQSQAQAAKQYADASDPATLNDALGSAGVDLRAEEEALHRSHDYGSQPSSSNYGREDRSRKQTVIDAKLMGSVLRTSAARQNVTGVSEDAVSYTILGLRSRLQTIMTAALGAKAHRTQSQFTRPPGKYPDGTPMWSEVIRRDVAKQLSAIEKVDREEDQRERIERRQRAEADATAAAQASADGEVEEETTKKKRKKEGPGVAAKNMTEDARKKVADAVAMQAAGLSNKQYSWMNSTPGTPPVKYTTPAVSAPPRTSTPVANKPLPPSNGWARAYVAPSAGTSAGTTQGSPGAAGKKRDWSSAAGAGAGEGEKLTLEDAMFVIQRERGHGGGRGSARGWT